MKLQAKSLLAPVILLLSAIPNAALATTLTPAQSGGGGTTGTLGFIVPLQNLASGLQLSALSLIIIAIVVIISTHMLNREDMAGLVRNMIFVIIAGSVLLASGTFLTQVGVQNTTGSMIL